MLCVCLMLIGHQTHAPAGLKITLGHAIADSIGRAHACRCRCIIYVAQWAWHVGNSMMLDAACWLDRWFCGLWVHRQMIHAQADISRLEHDIEGLQQSRRMVQEAKADSQRLHQAAEVRGRDLEDQVTIC